ncbi:MAG: hypothetical protein HC895_23610 [Leptolyngbyaceae cyanobacterium SM1_3_5]|nr:hypothetical protein [Leptolyngbyaceae cyanobacterium SM1_3_5]
MTHSLPPDQEPQDQPQDQPQPTSHRWRLMLLRAALISGGVTLVAGAIGAWWAWTFIQERLAPLVETNLSQTLESPDRSGRSGTGDADRIAVWRIDSAANGERSRSNCGRGG